MCIYDENVTRSGYGGRPTVKEITSSTNTARREIIVTLKKFSKNRVRIA